MFNVSRSTARLLVIAPFAALLAVACEHNLGPAIGPLATITVTPTPVTLAISAIQPFVATGRDARGNLVSITPTWSVVAPLAGTINSSSGLFTAGTTPGTGTIRATSGAIFGTATVTVTAPGGLAAISVTPNPGGALTGGTIQFTAAGQDATGAVITISPAPTWSVVAGGGTINASTGLFTAGTTPGTYTNTIRATSGGISGFATAIVTATPPPGPSLGTASTYGILAGASVTCAGPPGTINADVGISPGSTITGFGGALCQITGATNLGNALALAAQNDLTAAYDALVALPCTATIAAALGPTTTLAPGVYCSASSVQVNGALTLDGGGDANARFVIKAGSTLTTSTSANIVLTNGAQARNVWWQVGSSATIGTSSTFRGNILAFTSITLSGSDTFCGRALARNGSVSLSGIGNTITLPPTCS